MSGDLIRRLEQYRNELPVRVARAMRRGLEVILDESARLVPLEEAVLQNSGVVEVMVVGNRIIGAIGYGLGAAAPYALIQHENMSFRHDAGRSAKYLEIPWVRNRAMVMREIRKELIPT